MTSSGYESCSSAAGAIAGPTRGPDRAPAPALQGLIGALKSASSGGWGSLASQCAAGLRGRYVGRRNRGEERGHVSAWEWLSEMESLSLFRVHGAERNRLLAPLDAFGDRLEVQAVC